MDINIAIEILEINKLVSTHPGFVEAAGIAIKEMKKAIPAKPIDHGQWASKTCPTCGIDLSEHHGDGYYTDMCSLESCHHCRQLLEW